MTVSLTITRKFLEVVYTTLETKILPLKMKSTRFPSFQNFPCLTAFVKKVIEDALALNVKMNQLSSLSSAQQLVLYQLDKSDFVMI